MYQRERERFGMKHMTALVSCFARAYHFKNSEEPVFGDNVADRLLTEKEYGEIADNMAAGISYFAPDFSGSKEEALRHIVNSQLAPSVLARSAFCERALENEIGLGCRQYVVFASGYDTYSLRRENPELVVYELDLPDMIADKKRRIETAGLKDLCRQRFVPCDLSEKGWVDFLEQKGFCRKGRSFGSLLGLSYYLEKEDFAKLLSSIQSLWGEGSAICFDYPVCEEGRESAVNRELAAGANESMKAKYTYKEMEKLLAENGFLIYEHLDEKLATGQFFEKYNQENPGYEMKAPKGVNYCLAVRKGTI